MIYYANNVHSVSGLMHILHDHNCKAEFYYKTVFIYYTVSPKKISNIIDSTTF